MSISANFPNVKPSLLLDFANAQQLPPTVTFTRATTATYYPGESVLTSQNIAYPSVGFGAPWNNGACIVTTGQTDPLGTTTAIKAAPDTSTSQHLFGLLGVMTPNAATLSVFAKAAGLTTVRIDGNSGAQTALFNLSTGTVTSTTGDVVASISSFGNGWYRVSLTQATPKASFAIWPGGNQGTYAGNGTDGILIWGAQAETNNFLTAYTPTTSAPFVLSSPTVATAGGGQPRFDHNPTTDESLGLLVEEQRTNIYTYSNIGNSTVFSAAYGVGPNAINLGSTIGPDGTLSARRLYSTTSSNSFFQRNSITISTVGTYVFSIWVRLVSGPSPNNFSGFFSSFSQAVTMNAAPTSQWSRVFGTITFASTGSSAFTLPFYDAPTGCTIDYFGPQLELGSFPTSYIATDSASATRAADVVSMTGTNFSSWYSPADGTFYAEASTASVASDVMIAEGSNSAGLFLDFSVTFATTSTQFINRFTYANNDMRKSGAVAANTMVKFTGSITGTTGTTIAATNGATTSATGSQSMNYGADRMFIGSRNGSSLFLNAPIRKIAFYPVQLTQTQQNSITG